MFLTTDESGDDDILEGSVHELFPQYIETSETNVALFLPIMYNFPVYNHPQHPSKIASSTPNM